MEKKYKSRTSFLGLIFTLALCCCPILGSASLVWESPAPPKEFSFEGYDQVLINSALFADPLEKQLLSSLKQALGNSGKLQFLQKLDSESIGIIAQSPLVLEVMSLQSKSPEFQGLVIQARANATANLNRTAFSAVVWKREIWLEKGDLEGLSKALDQAVKMFVQQYLHSRREEKKEARFYYPDPMGRLALLKRTS